eukprot:COSAG05_NODE_5851_length_1073_cov_8.220739_1_plen_305_part_01
MACMRWDWIGEDDDDDTNGRRAGALPASAGAAAAAAMGDPAVLLCGKLGRQWRALAAQVTHGPAAENEEAYGVHSAEMQAWMAARMRLWAWGMGQAFGPSAGRFYPPWRAATPHLIDVVLFDSRITRTVVAPMWMCAIGMNAVLSVRVCAVWVTFRAVSSVKRTIRAAGNAPKRAVVQSVLAPVMAGVIVGLLVCDVVGCVVAGARGIERAFRVRLYARRRRTGLRSWMRLSVVIGMLLMCPGVKAMPIAGEQGPEDMDMLMPGYASAVVEAAAAAAPYTDSMVIVSDLRGAWDRCVVTSQRAIG